MLKEFKNFVFRGNIVELAVAFVMGVAIAAAVFFIVKPVQMMLARAWREPIEKGMPDEERRHQEQLAALTAFSRS
jgi:large-conductance mechanosensitive channel